MPTYFGGIVMKLSDYKEERIKDSEFAEIFKEEKEYITKEKAIEIASGYCHWTNIPKELEKLEPENVVSKEVVENILAYVESMNNKGMGKQKSLENISKYIRATLGENVHE